MEKLTGKKKAVLSIISILIIILSYSSVLDMVCQKTIDKNAETYFSETFAKAAYTYGIARATNALISAVQSTRISGAPGGVGVAVGVGEVLDPLNDLIERFSAIMLISLSSLGVQLILMEIGSWVGFKVLLSISMIIVLIGAWYPKLGKFNVLALGYKLIIVSIVVRFCIPAVGILGNLTDEIILNDKYEKSTESIESFNTELDDLVTVMEPFESEEKENLPVEKNLENTKEKTENSSVSEKSEMEAETGFWGKLKSTFTFSPSKFVADKLGFIKSIKEKISDIVPRIIDLIVIFVIKTILLPLFVLWLLVKLAGYIAGGHVAAQIEERIRGIVNKKDSDKIKGEIEPAAAE